MGDNRDKSAARLPEGSLVETRCLIKGHKSAIVTFAEPHFGPKSRTGSGVFSVKRRADICRCLPPDTTWHKVKSPKAD